MNGLRYICLKFWILAWSIVKGFTFITRVKGLGDSERAVICLSFGCSVDRFVVIGEARTVLD